MARFWSETMARYAFSASLLVLTLALALMAALTLGAFPLAGSAGTVLAVQSALHAALVQPLGKPLAVGLVLFCGLWPTFLIFGQAQLRRGKAEPEADMALERYPDEEAPEPSAAAALDRITRRHRDPEPVEAEQEVESDDPEEAPEPVETEAQVPLAGIETASDPDAAAVPETDTQPDDVDATEPGAGSEPGSEPEPENDPEFTAAPDEPLVPFDDVTPEPDGVGEPETEGDYRPDTEPLPEADFEPFPSEDVMPDGGFPDTGDNGADDSSHLPTVPEPGTEIIDEEADKRPYASLAKVLPYGNEGDVEEVDEEEADAEDGTGAFVRPAWLDDVERQAIVHAPASTATGKSGAELLWRRTDRPAGF